MRIVSIDYFPQNFIQKVLLREYYTVLIKKGYLRLLDYFISETENYNKRIVSKLSYVAFPIGNQNSLVNLIRKVKF